MGLFTSKKKKWRRKMQDDALCRTEFGQLERAMGRGNAKLFLETVYDKWVNGFSYPIDNLTPDMCSHFMKVERECYTSRRQYVDSLVPRARTGELGVVLNSNLRDVNDYYQSREGTALAGRDLAIDQAANWVCGNYTAALPNTRALLRSYIPVRGGDHGKAGGALGPSTKHLRAIWKKAVPEAGEYRINLTGGAKYPSTVGGSHLLEYIVCSTAGTNWPQFGDPHWESIAMFYLVSIVHVQGFSDGNKRTGHLAYAIVLIKGTHAFKAPTTAKEGELFRMNQ